MEKRYVNGVLEVKRGSDKEMSMKTETAEIITGEAQTSEVGCELEEKELLD